jgi:two-component system chemotaxis response regulator CheY
MDGITLLKTLKQDRNHRFTPVLMLTTESEQSKKAEGQAAGAKAWMVKPFQPEQLLSAVQKLTM